MGRFIPINDVIKLPMLSGGDILQRSKGRFLTYAKYVWQDMNLATVKIAKRELFYINKRTNTVDLPKDFLQLSSVNIIEHGNFIPVFRNDKIHDDIVDVSAKKYCACENSCSYILCNLVKGYEAVQTTVSDILPNGDPISFNAVSRTAVDRNGFLYQENQFIERVYTNGVWTGTILQTENKKLCTLDLDDNGCICDTEDNFNAVCSHCNIPTNFGCSPTLAGFPVGGNAQAPPQPNDSSWIYYCNTKADWLSVQCGAYGRTKVNNIYNISELGDRLIFPCDFGFDRVMVRYYADVSLADLQIPFIAVDTFVTGLKWWDCRWNDKKLSLAQKYEADYTKLKWGLFLELNKYRIAELRMILTPPVKMPSYLPLHGHSGWENAPLY